MTARAPTSRATMIRASQEVTNPRARALLHLDDANVYLTLEAARIAPLHDGGMPPDVARSFGPAADDDTVDPSAAGVTCRPRCRPQPVNAATIETRISRRRDGVQSARPLVAPGVMRIFFEDHGQDFLWWDVHPWSGVVHDCGPFVAWPWVGKVLETTRLSPGDQVRYYWGHGLRTIRVPVARVEADK